MKNKKVSIVNQQYNLQLKVAELNSKSDFVMVIANQNYIFSPKIKRTL
ncbi:hypothetical protein [Colwellia demingiae]|nr:hypothetical protein [Colwellia demingiae]